jgi:transposase
MMGLKTRLITEEIYNKGKSILENVSQTSRAAIRLRAIVAARDHGVNLVAKVFDISSNTLRSWVKSFAAGEFEGLDYKAGRGRKSNICENHQIAIYQWIKEDCNLTLDRIVIKLDESFKVKSSKSAVHRILQKLNLSYITPRPKHYKQDQNLQAEFKKKSRDSKNK